MPRSKGFIVVHALILLLVAAVFLTGCSYYATFSSKVKELDFTVEYPRQWWVTDVEQYPDLVTFNIVGPEVSGNESGLWFSFVVWPSTGTDVDLQARDRLNSYISTDEKERNFKLVTNDTIDIDGVRGYRVEYTLDHLAKEVPTTVQRTYIAIRERLVFVPRNGRVYEIFMAASQNEWDRRANVIQHVLETFKWK